VSLGRFHTAPVLLDLARLQASTAEELRRVCRRLGARPLDWRSDQPEPHPPAAALVSGLRWGERALPEELLQQVEAGARRLPLLMVSAEPLVAPAVTLHDGLVTLAEAEPGRLYGALRRLLLRVAGGTSTLDPGAPAVDERCEARLWYAAASVLLYRRAGQLSALLPFEARSSFDEPFLADLSAGLLAGRDASAELGQLLGQRAGFVGLWSDAREWLIYWPSSAAPLWLCSGKRLPQVSDFRLSPGAPTPAAIRLAVEPGEALVALGGPPPAGLMAPTAEEGAPSWLETALHLLAVQPGFRSLAIEALS
jgi:hypothetical protein